ncbi:MAG: oligosaccharide flippase family protein [Syntrophomonadaceae bacterium]|nr:oligosaccharide flippase family protein [Syntrophomonadaceae bacterium]
MIDKLREALASKLPPGSFIRNVVTLITGTTFAQALMILVAPILTRLYSPGDFGVYALYASILGIIAVVACWRYELAIVLPEKDEDAANLLVLSICICFGMAVFTLILVALFHNSVANLFGAPKLAPWLWFLPLSLLATGLFMAFNYWSTRRKQFRRLAVRQITQSTVTAATQLGIGYVMRTGPGGLIGGSILGQLTATGRLAWQIWQDEGKPIWNSIGWNKLKRQLSRYRKFPLYSSWSGMLSTASNMLPALLLGYFFAPAVVGYYALGHRVLAMPMGVVGGSIAQAFFPRATEAKRKGNLDKITFEMFQQLLAIGLVPILLITIVAPDLFALVFGSRWWIAGEYVRWLSLWMFFNFISSPLSNMYLVLERQRAGLIVNAVMFSTRLLALIIGGIKGDALFTIALFGLTGAILWIFNCTYILYMAGVPALQVYDTILREAIRSVPYALLPLVAWFVFKNSLVFVLAGITAGILFLIVKGIQMKKTGV